MPIYVFLIMNAPIKSALKPSTTCAYPQGGQGVQTPPPPTPLKNHKNLGFLCKTGPDPMKNPKTTMQEFNVGPSLARL